LKTDSHIALQKLLFTQVYNATHEHYFNVIGVRNLFLR